MTFYKWSRTASDDATADSTINWAEGQSPSSVNDSARAMMAATAKYRDDIAGAITTGGTSTAYTITSYQVFDTLAHLNGQVIAFTPHATNGASVTLNVDGLGAKPLRAQPSVDLQSGVLVQGTPYAALYNSSDAAFYLFGVGNNPGIPLGSSIDYWGTTAPSSHFVLAYGQAISRTTYATLFSLFSTTYGTGDGSTTFNVPDLRGRVVAGLDPMGGSAAGRLTDAVSGFGDTLGEAGGAQSVTLTAAQIPTITSNNAAQLITVSAITGGAVLWNGSGSPASVNATGGSYNTTTSISVSGNNSISVTSNNTSGGAHSNVQPTIVANKLLRII